MQRDQHPDASSVLELIASLLAADSPPHQEAPEEPAMQHVTTEDRAAMALDNAVLPTVTAVHMNNTTSHDDRVERRLNMLVSRVDALAARLDALSEMCEFLARRR